LLEAVDRSVERDLAHRFERTGAMGGELVAVLRQHEQAMLQTTENLVERQAAIWARALGEVSRRRTDLEADFRQQLEAALSKALDTSLQAHGQRLAALEKQAAGPAAMLVERLGSLGKVAEALMAQAETLARLQEGEKHLVRLQQELQENLAAL